ncbi:hypothetical protein BFP76_02500 [Amylibacter kogurei]|uniref:Uncharacterized protein n=1 Tax=Paramylibacter kogurei TaxID=1889778 RepID=A0A2G5K4V4_9RHOB|nr:hypothetical protein BFP76_02500 [Amylibacter kogurei]
MVLLCEFDPLRILRTKFFSVKLLVLLVFFTISLFLLNLDRLGKFCAGDRTKQFEILEVS